MLSRHLCPGLLAEELKKFRREAEVFITHLKPGEVESMMRETGNCIQRNTLRMLLNNREFEF